MTIDWDAYNALPEWEVTVILSRTARFRVHASSPDEASARVAQAKKAVRSLQDLHDGDIDLKRIVSVESVSDAAT